MTARVFLLVRESRVRVFLDRNGVSCRQYIVLGREMSCVRTGVVSNGHDMDSIPSVSLIVRDRLLVEYVFFFFSTDRSKDHTRLKYYKRTRAMKYLI